MTALLKVKGNLGADPVLNHTREGVPVLGLTVAHTPRRRNKDTGKWEDAGETLWVRASVWTNAEKYAELLRKGSLVVIEGEPVMRAWQNGERSGVSLEIPRADVAMYPRAERREDAPAQDAWHDPAGEDVPW